MFHVVAQNDHNAAFPDELPRRCLRMCSLPGDTVLDPFGGAGTTGAAARQMGRHSITIESDPNHHRTCVERLRRAAPPPPRKKRPLGRST